MFKQVLEYVKRKKEILKKDPLYIILCRKVRL